MGMAFRMLVTTVHSMPPQIKPIAMRMGWEMFVTRRSLLDPISLAAPATQIAQDSGIPVSPSELGFPETRPQEAQPTASIETKLVVLDLLIPMGTR
jgi:hypothetical protein